MTLKSLNEIELFDKEGGLILTEENATVLRHYFFPAGSGPLDVMRMVCRILDAVAREKGWDIGQNVRPLDRHKSKRRET